VARSSPATTPRSLAKPGWQLPMSHLEFSIQHEEYAVHLMACFSFKNIIYNTTQVQMKLQLLSLMHEGYCTGDIRISKLSLVVTRQGTQASA